MFCAFHATQAGAQAGGEFYRGKTISLIIGYSPGGGYDTYARLIARSLGKHIPGNPAIAPQNMPGASSRVALAYLYNAAAKDGTALATGDQSLSMAQAMGEKLAFDVTHFNYIGNPDAENNTTATWHASGVNSIDDAKTRDVPVGATGGSPSSQIPKALNAVLGTRFKIVLGYPGGADIDPAMERGEVAGRGSNSWASWKATRPEWLRDHKINILVQVGLDKAHDLPDVPLFLDLASTPEDKAVVRALSTPSTIGRPILAPPGTPQDRIAILRSGFDAMIHDPEFLDAAQAARLEINAVPGARLQEIVAGMSATPKPTMARLTAILASAEN